MKTILEKFQNHPIFRDFEKQEAEKLQNQRKQWAGELSKLQAEQDTLVKTKNKDLENRQKAVKEAEQRLKDLQTEWMQAKSEHDRKNHLIVTSMKELKAQLKETAPKEIDNAIDFFRAELDKLRKPGKIQTQKASEQKDLVNWTKKTEWITNQVWLHERMKYCQAAIAALENSKLEAELNLANIEKLQKGLPKEYWKPIQSEKDMEKLAPSEFELLPGLLAIAEHQVEQLLYPQRFKKYERTTEELLNM